MNCQAIRRTDLSRDSSKEQVIHDRETHANEGRGMDGFGGVQGVVRGVTPAIVEATVKDEMNFTVWIEEWRHSRKLRFSTDSKHFFLEGADLDDFTKQAIRTAEKTIFVANPYLESCYLTDYLMDSATSQVEIRIVTRQPESVDKSFAKRVECHSKLRKKGITLYYDNQIHSKIITVDNKVAIVSSMNFYSGSSGGASREAGIVSIHPKVVESATDYIRKLLDGS